jgi:hypothetical protein
MHGLEFRHPLRDPELVELVLGLPPRLAYDAHLDRPLLRRALAGDLPPDTLREDRKPTFNALLDDALAGPDRARLRALLRRPDPVVASFVRPDALAELSSRPQRGARALDLWRLASLQIWLAHGAGDPALEAVSSAPDEDA